MKRRVDLQPAVEGVFDGHLQTRGTLTALFLAALSFSLLQTMVSPALPAMQMDFDASAGSVTWVLTVFLLAASIATPILARLGEVFGKARMLEISLCLLGLGCLLAAVANSLLLLVVARGIQGAAGAIVPLAYGLIRDQFPARRVASAIGLVSATLGAGGAIGLLLAGVIVDQLSYEWIFWLSFGSVMAAMVFTRVFVRDSFARSLRSQVDWTGAALLSSTLALILVVVSRGSVWDWNSGKVLGTSFVAALLLVAWLFWEIRHPHPLLDLRLLAVPAVWATNVAGFLLGAGMFSMFILLPQLAQTRGSQELATHANVTLAGLFMLPSALTMLLASPLAGYIESRCGSPRILIVGVANMAASFALLSATRRDVWEVLLASALVGVGVGLSLTAMANILIARVPASSVAEVSGVNALMRMLGGAIGAQAVAALLSAKAVNGHATSEGFATAFACCAVVVSAALVFIVPLAKKSAPA